MTQTLSQSPVLLTVIVTISLVIVAADGPHGQQQPLGPQRPQFGPRLPKSLIIAKRFNDHPSQQQHNCKDNDDIECLDRHVNELFVNINRFYSPNTNYIDISYLNHPWYNSTVKFNKSFVLKKIEQISSLSMYDDEERQIIESFPTPKPEDVVP